MTIGPDAGILGLKRADDAEIGVLGHILAAKEIWLVRLNGKDSSSIDTLPEFLSTSAESSQMN